MNNPQKQNTIIIQFSNGVESYTLQTAKTQVYKYINIPQQQNVEKLSTIYHSYYAQWYIHCRSE